MEVIVVVLGDAPGSGAAQVHPPAGAIVEYGHYGVLQLQHSWPHLALQHVVEEGLCRVDAHLLGVIPHPELELQLQVLMVQQSLALVLSTYSTYSNAKLSSWLSCLF